MKPFVLSLSILLISSAMTLATDIQIPSPAAGTSNAPTPASAPSPAAASTPSAKQPLATRPLSEIHSTMLLPQDWTLIPGKLLEGDVLLATREKIASESDPWSTGLSMSIDRNGAKDSGQPASDYARSLAKEAREKAGEEATPIRETRSGPMLELRFEFPVNGDQPLLVTEVLRANDKTGTLAVILWQSPKDEASGIQELREQILSGIKLDPNQ